MCNITMNINLMSTLTLAFGTAAQKAFHTVYKTLQITLTWAVKQNTEVIPTT